MTELIIKAHDVLEEFKSDPDYQKLKEMKKKVETHYKNDIVAFNEAKAKFDQVLSEGGTHHPDYKSTIKALSEAKSTLYSHQDLKDYVSIEKTFETKLNTFISTLSKHISDHIQTPNELGLFKKEGGGCHVH
ncbi:MAG: YlbF family regulator [Acholeplasmataceae bacterium]